MAYTSVPTTQGMLVSGPPSGARLEVGSCTDPGREPSKQINEDAAFARETPHGHLAVVCDGMGGHVGGREASHLAVETIFRTFDEAPAGVAPAELLARSIKAANHAVHSRGQSTPELSKMGSTCVAVLSHAGGTEVAHVGDSRVYLITQGQAYQVTKDHSLVQRLVDANMLTPEEASNHPNANQITNALGMRPDVDVEVRPQPFPYVPGDTFLLCSDGLSDELGPADFLQILAPYPTLDVAARQLVDLANARGGHDNITVVLVRVPGGGPFVPPPVSGPPGGRVNTPVATPIAFPSPGNVAPTATLDLAAAGGQPISGAPPFAPPPAFVPPAPYASAPTPAEPQRKSKAGLVIAIVVVLLLVAGGIGAALYYRASQPTEAPSSSSSAEPEPSTSSSTPAKKPKPKPSTTTTATEATTEPSASGAPTGTGTGTRPTTTTQPTTTTTSPTELVPSDTVKTPFPTPTVTPGGDETVKRTHE
jgi:protein phosphatase